MGGKIIMARRPDWEIITRKDVRVGDKILVKYNFGCWIFLEYEILEIIEDSFKVKNLISNNYLWTDLSVTKESQGTFKIYRLSSNKKEIDLKEFYTKIIEGLQQQLREKETELTLLKEILEEKE